MISFQHSSFLFPNIHLYSLILSPIFMQPYSSIYFYFFYKVSSFHYFYSLLPPFIFMQSQPFNHLCTVLFYPFLQSYFNIYFYTVLFPHLSLHSLILTFIFSLILSSLQSYFHIHLYCLISSFIFKFYETYEIKIKHVK